MRAYRIAWMFGPCESSEDALDLRVPLAFDALLARLGVDRMPHARIKAMYSGDDQVVRSVRARRWRPGTLSERIAECPGARQVELIVSDCGDEPDTCNVYGEVALTNEGKFGEARVSFGRASSRGGFFSIIALDETMIEHTDDFDRHVRDYAAEAGAVVGVILARRAWIFSRDGGQGGPPNAIHNLIGQAPSSTVDPWMRDLAAWAPLGDAPLVIGSPAVTADQSITASRPLPSPIEGRESDPRAFDKAKWHYEGTYPPGLTELHASVHIGLYLAWTVIRGLANPAFFDRGQAPRSSPMAATWAPADVG